MQVSVSKNSIVALIYIAEYLTGKSKNQDFDDCHF